MNTDVRSSLRALRTPSRLGARSFDSSRHEKEFMEILSFPSTGYEQSTQLQLNDLKKVSSFDLSRSSAEQVRGIGNESQKGPFKSEKPLSIAQIRARGNARFGRSHSVTDIVTNTKGIRFAESTKHSMPANLDVRCMRGTDVRPFVDGIAEVEDHNATTRHRNILDDLPTAFALKLIWPIDVGDYNAARKSKREVEKSSTSLKLGSPSLVHYHKYLEVYDDDDSIVGTIKLDKGPNCVPGKVIARATCENPCWTTASRRYESSIRFGIGRAGVSSLTHKGKEGRWLIIESLSSLATKRKPYVWEAKPQAPKNSRSRESVWALYHLPSGFRTTVRNEDLDGLVSSATYLDGQVFTTSGEFAVRIQPEASTAHRSEAAYFDYDDGYGTLHFDIRPRGTAYRRTGAREPIDPLFLIAFFETVNAMRDESASAGKGRRDERGRLVAGHRQSGFMKTLQRFIAG